VAISYFAAMGIDKREAIRSSVSEDVSVAQIVTAITTVFYAGVFAIGYYMIIRGNREVLREMREERLSGGRPQIIVEVSLINLPIMEFVVRHVSGGAAKDITFEISRPIEDSSGYRISELPYLKEGIPLLGPGERIRCLWDHVDRLMPALRDQGLYEGLRYDASQLSQGSSTVLQENSPSADAETDKTRAVSKESKGG
jgi:hypothetical protein